MSDRDSDTGQFAPAEPLTGQAGIEADHGYVPLEEPQPDEEPLGESTIEQEAARLAAQRATSDGEVRTYSGVADLDKNVTLTIEQAAKIASDDHKADAAQIETDQDQAIRDEVDKLRGVDPNAKNDEIKAAQTEEAPPVNDGDLDIERVLSNPKITEAINERVTAAETARQTHLAGLQAATEMVKASLLGQFPEVAQIANLPPEQQANAIAQMMQREPARAENLARSIHNMQNLMQQQAEQTRQQAERERAEIQSYVKTESARFDEMIKSEPPAQRAAITNEIVEAIKEYGGDKEEFIELMRSSKFSSATVQRLLWDVGKLRLIQKAPKALATKTLPPVQRPGTASVHSRNQGVASQIATLNKQMADASPTKQIKLSAQIMRLQREARG